MMRFICFTLLYALFLGTSCKKDSTTESTSTYEITYTVTRASVGTTTFEEIRYYDGSKEAVLTNTTNNFTVTHAIKSGDPIRLSVKGNVVNASTTPSVLASFLVEKVTDGQTRTVVCQQAGSSVSGNSTKYTFSSSFSQTFNGTTCQ